MLLSSWLLGMTFGGLIVNGWLYRRIARAGQASPPAIGGGTLLGIGTHFLFSLGMLTLINLLVAIPEEEQEELSYYVTTFALSFVATPVALTFILSRTTSDVSEQAREE